MDLLASLGNLATNVKNVTLPGVLAAIAFALLLWPPQPYDRIPTVEDNHLDVTSLQLRAKEFANDSTASFGLYRSQSSAACTVKEGEGSYTFLTILSSFKDRAAVAVKNQLILDDLDRALWKCVEEEQALQGVEDQVVANVTLLIATRTTERDGLNGLYQKYIQTLSPMKAEFEKKVLDKECAIAALQTHLLNFQRLQKERARRIAELQRLEKEMTARLGDAGRLRPIQKFDDILSGLSTHIVGFLTLVFAWGLLIDPVNRALFSFIYDTGFDNEWDSVRPVRQTPGDNARKKWEDKVKPPEKSEDRIAVQGSGPGQDPGDAQDGGTGQDGSQHPWIYEAIDAIRSSLWLSLIAVLVCVAAAVATVVLWHPSSPIRDTATILSTNSTSFVDRSSATFIARIISVGSLEEPSGTVVFQWDGKDIGLFPLVNGKAQDKVDLIQGSHKIIAKYVPPEPGSVASCQDCPPFQSSESLPFEFVVPAQPSDADERKQELKMPVAKAHRDKSKKQSEACPDPTDESTPATQPSPQNASPDLSKLRPPFKRDLLKCVIVMFLALIAGFFLPSVLRSFVASPATETEYMPKRKVSAFKRAMEGDPTAKLDCEQKLAKEWPKISQPQYAIGQGLMARTDFEKLQNTYYSQSLISTGLIFPLCIFVFALLVTPQLGFGNAGLYLILGGGEVLLLMTGVDSRHKYFAELDTLISSAFLKACKSNQQSTTDKSDKSVASQISDALKAAKIIKTTDLVIQPDDTPPKSGEEALAADTAALIQARLKEKLSKAKPTQYKVSAGEVPAATPPPSPTSGKTDTPAGDTGKTGDPSGKQGSK